MSDFSELCPLFNTGVFHEITFSDIRMTGITACGNFFLGVLTAGSVTKPGIFTFGRTVVITDAFVKQRAKISVDSTTIVLLQHYTSQLAAGTEFMSLAISTTASSIETYYTWMPMNVTTSATFTSNEVLGFGVLTGTASSGGTFELIVRYKEK